MNSLTLYKWLKGANDIFDAFESRGDAYNLCKRWVNDWFQNKKFEICHTDIEYLRNDFKESIYKLMNITLKKDKQLNEEEKQELNRLISGNIDHLINEIPNNTDKLAFAFAPYIVSWNFQRFKEYFKKREEWFENLKISDKEKFKALLKYFELLSNRLSHLEDLKSLRDKNLFETDIETNKLENILNLFNDLLKELGIKTQDEYTMVAKILHLISSYYIPLIDTKIAKRLKSQNIVEFEEVWIGEGRKEVKVNSKGLINYMQWIKSTFANFKEIISILEEETKKPFLKLLDQAFYIRYSIDIAKRLKEQD